MPDMGTLAEGRLEELLEYLDGAPVKLDSAIFHDELYELAYASVMDDLVAAAEARRDEGVEEEWDNDQN